MSLTQVMEQTEKGGAFTSYDKYISGFNLDLVPGKRIVQAWRSREWPKGLFSIVTFELLAQSGGKTKLVFTHVGLPSAQDAKEKKEGWRDFYWDPLNEYFSD